MLARLLTVALLLLARPAPPASQPLAWFLATLRRRLAEHFQGMRERTPSPDQALPLDSDARAKLRALGYVE